MPPVQPEAQSPYAPPRAGRDAGLWRVWFALRRRTRLGDLSIPPPLRLLDKLARPWAGLGVFIVPTLGLWLLPNRYWPRIGVPLFALALFFALTEYSRTTGGYAFGLAAAIHGVGAAAFYDLEDPLPRYLTRLFRRLGIVTLSALALALGAYLTTSRIIVAVAGKDGPLIVSKFSPDRQPQVGELIAYRIEDQQGGGIQIRGGTYLGRVLATEPGQRIAFQPDHYAIDGLRFPRLPNMPADGSFLIDKDQSFIWPEVFHITYARNLPAGLGFVRHSALVGRPLNRWFWHTQTP